MTSASPRIERLASFSLVSTDASTLATFYQQAFGCRIALPITTLPEARHCLVLTLGAQRIALLEFAPPGRSYPRASLSCDLSFQHLAIVVRDMGRAFERLSVVSGWSAISTHGPQRLPASSGGVTAFKFRDPEGHPLELLEFAPEHSPDYWRAAAGDLHLGIDHSAISVADSERSIAFYRTLGFEPVARTLNQGPEQARLDGLAHPRVEVSALSVSQTPPHLELLCYREPAPQVRAFDSHDLLATRSVLQTRGPGSSQPQLIRDPDGHLLLMTGASG